MSRPPQIIVTYARNLPWSYDRIIKACISQILEDFLCQPTSKPLRDYSLYGDNRITAPLDHLNSPELNPYFH